MNWKKIELITDEEKYNKTFFLYGPTLVHPDFNEEGVVEGFWQDDDGFIGAIWNNCSDSYDTKVVKPTYFCVKEGPKL